MKTEVCWLLFGCLGIFGTAIAGEADVLSARVTAEAAGTYRFSVTVQHADDGWNHYADEWQVVAADGSVLGSRTLYHPHVGEQPFTRSLAGVSIPADTKSVIIRAADSVHGYGGKTVLLNLP